MQISPARAAIRPRVGSAVLCVYLRAGCFQRPPAKVATRGDSGRDNGRLARFLSAPRGRLRERGHNGVEAVMGREFISGRRD